MTMPTLMLGSLTTALMVGPLRGKPTILTAVSPTMGDINIYDTVTAGTPFAMNLPQLGAGVQTPGAITLLGKDPNDTTTNTLTFNCYAGDTFVDGSTSLVIQNGGTQRTLEVVSVLGAPKWMVIGGLGDIGSPSTATGSSDPDLDDESDESPVDPYILTADAAAAMDTRYAQQFPAGTGYGGYGDGAYGYGQ